MLELFCINLILYIALFIWAHLRRNYAHVDILWGPSFMLMSGYLIFFKAIDGPRSLLIFFLISIWAIRLGGYLFMRTMRMKEEDFRYKQMRAGWGRHIGINAFFKVFILQALVSYIIAIPVNLSILSGVESTFPSYLDILGVTLWMIGFCCESIADYQKSKFKKCRENEGRILRTGLWRYSRHPNYFGECLLWWGLFLIALNNTNILISLISPVLLTFLLLKVSGVSLLEKKYKSNREYDDYKKETSAFIPMKPKTLE